MTAISTSLYRYKEYLRTGVQSTASTRPSITSVCSDIEEAARAANASDSRKGFVELATSAETITGTDTERAVTPAALAAVVATLPVQQTFVIPGTLVANHIFNVMLPRAMKLIHVSLCNQSANVGTLKVGKPADDDYYLAAENFGVSGTPAEVATAAGFDGVGAGGAYPTIADGGTVTITVSDHPSHMSGVCVVLTYVAA